MKRQRESLVIIILMAAALFGLHTFARGDVFTFGHHGAIVRVLSEILLALLCLTDVFLVGIMWIQRRRWDQAEASLFRFLAARALLWGFSLIYSHQNPGITLSYGFLLIILLMTAFDLNIRLVQRYARRREDAATDRRMGDLAGTAGAERILRRAAHWTDETGEGR